MAQQARVLHYIRLEMLVRGEQSSLMDPFANYAKNELLWMQTLILSSFSVSDQQPDGAHSDGPLEGQTLRVRPLQGSVHFPQTPGKK
jgi:hypothetical protein